MSHKQYSTPVSLKNVKVEEGFWKESMELIRTEVLPYQWETLNDRVEGAPPSFCMRNFRVAAKLMKEMREKGEAFEEPKYTFRGFEVLPEDMKHMEDKFYGFVFQDSDFSKWIEAVAYSLMNHPDPELEAIVDGAIETVCEAQRPDGYLDTYYIINGMDKRFTNLKDHHELYCFGHLTEAAVAYYQATGKDGLLHAAMRFADYIDAYFGPEEGKCKGYPGHEVAEMALVKLYEATGEARYLNLSRFFIDERGKKPHYWDKETGLSGSEEERYAYNQAHVPVREQDEAVGHAVRAMYLYSGMADVARLTEDEELWGACRRLWDSTVHEKMYITGGVGATAVGEAFSFPFDLPNDLAYAETCASIGLIFFARRMFEKEARSEYADVMELALYNTVLSGMQLDGRSFFYVNPLEVLPEACHKDERKSHVKPIRQKWFGCACCPPNLARLLSSIPSYAYTENDSTLYMHLYIGGTVTKTVYGHTVSIGVKSDFPWEGNVTATVSAREPVFMKLAFRVPGWCRGWTIDAGADKQCELIDGYYYVEGEWKEGDRVELHFPMKPVFVQADPRVREDIGKTALMRGPIVYCAEEADNGRNLHLKCLVPTGNVEVGDMEINGHRVKALFAEGKRVKERGDSGENIENRVNIENGTACRKHALYGEYRSLEYEDMNMTLIPYYAWANRGEGEMQVWMRAYDGR